MSDSMNGRFYEINELQADIMHFINQWAKEKRTPIPQREIVDAMLIEGVKALTTANALRILMGKGYIRRAVVISNKTAYVQLRTI